MKQYTPIKMHFLFTLQDIYKLSSEPKLINWIKGSCSYFVSMFLFMGSDGVAIKVIHEHEIILERFT